MSLIGIHLNKCLFKIWASSPNDSITPEIIKTNNTSILTHSLCTTKHYIQVASTSYKPIMET